MSRTLHHLPLSPFCRKIRIILGEKHILFDLKIEKPWDQREEFMGLNHGGTVPVFVDEDGSVIAESGAIAEYLEETYPQRPILPGTPAERAEIRRIAQWFDIKFDADVRAPVLFEKIDRRLMKQGEPNIETIRVGLENINYHMDYVSWLAEERNWLAGDHFSLADITAAAHISAIDYVGDVPWTHFPHAKEWYVRVKSRPSFRAILGDFLPGMPPPRIYADLDF